MNPEQDPVRYTAANMLIAAGLLLALRACDCALDGLYALELWLLKQGRRYG